MNSKSRYFQLIDGTTADMVGFFEDQKAVDEVLVESLVRNGEDSVRSLVLLVGNETGPDTTMSGDELVRYAKSLTRPVSFA
jgi:hypothetical protein